MADEEAVTSEPVTDEPTAASRPATASVSRPATSQSAAGRSNSRPASTVSRPKSSQLVPPPSDSRPSSSGGWTPEPDTVSIKSKSTNDDTAALVVDEEPPKGCWHSFTRCVGGMWATREMTQNDDREIFVRTTIRELVVYCIFLVILCILTFGMTSATMFYYTQVMQNLFGGYKEVNQVTDFWNFMEGELLDGLYWEYLYNDGTDKRFECPGGEEAVGPCPVVAADRNILYENRLLGLPRLRMLKVRGDSCQIHPDFQNAIKDCYEEYSLSAEDHSPFGTGFRHRTSSTAWTYHNASETKGSDHSGVFSITYGGGGSYQDFHSLKNETKAIIKELKEGLWIGRGTRFVSVDFTVYNANINLFCIIKFTFEFPATGGVVSSAYFRTVNLLRYVSSWDHFIMAAELIFVGFVFYYMVEEALEIKKHKIPYFMSVWNVLDCVVLIISCICIGFNVYSILNVESKLKDLLDQPDQFADFTFLASLTKTNNNFIAICVFFAWIKLFKYISFNKTMTQLSSTLSRCAADVLGFAVMFFIVFFAFAQLGYLLFGTQVEDFSRFDTAIFTLLRTILGDFNFHEIEAANRVLGPIFFLCYVFFVFFVLLNMFLAIINDTYSEVKAEIAAQRNEFEIGDYFKRGYNNMLGKVGARNKYIDIENALKLANSDGTVTYEEIRQNLKKANFCDLEIEMFFSKYDKDGNFVFSTDETNRALNDIEFDRVEDPPHGHGGARPKSGKEARSARSARIKSGMDRRESRCIGGISGEEFQVLGRRVDRMERSIGSIVSKIDAVLAKLETMEKGRVKRKQTMSKILGTITEDDGADEATKRKQMEDLVRKELDEWDSSRPGTQESGRH